MAASRNLDTARLANKVSSSEGSVTVNSSTAVQLVPANPDRVLLVVSNNSNQAVWLRDYPATQDDIKQGVLIASKERYTTPFVAIHTGVYSVILNSGGNSSINFVEYSKI